MLSAAIYLMCALTSILCAGLLFQNFRKNKTRLLLWSSICFFGLAANNILLFADLVLAPQIDMSIIRAVPALIGFGFLAWGLTWESL